MNQYKKFIEIEYEELMPEVKNVKILDEPLKFPVEFTPEWRQWITAQQTKNLDAMHKDDPIENLYVENTVFNYGEYSVPVRILYTYRKGTFPRFCLYSRRWMGFLRSGYTRSRLPILVRTFRVYCDIC